MGNLAFAPTNGFTAQIVVEDATGGPVSIDFLFLGDSEQEAEDEAYLLAEERGGTLLHFIAWPSRIVPEQARNFDRVTFA